MKIFALTKYVIGHKKNRPQDQANNIQSTTIKG